MTSNNYFSSVTNTSVQPSALTGGPLAGLFDFMSIRTLKGVATPTAIGNYAVVDVNTGNGIVLAPGECVLSVAIKGSSNIAVGGATTFNVGSSLTSGGAIVNSFLAAAKAFAAVQTGCIDSTAVKTCDSATNQYVSLTTATSTVTAGSVYVTLLIMNANNPQ